ncbi:hypothetical protein [Azohydromonas aeria]|uniref:hypothetical protein n=1 Tax=Azohydromonas aeria TaxID=2590212 RepID=UPI0012FADB50|nr:hypothetical protein [Azohydromonas aeria]
MSSFKPLLPFLLSGLLAGLTALPARAAEADAASLPMPCVGPVCVNAGLQSLLDLPWKAVAQPRAEGVQQVKLQDRMAQALRGDAAAVQTVLAHWPGRWFGAPALRALASLDAVCEDMGVWWRPHAALDGPGGSRLLVAFEPVPSPRGRQQFRVANVSVQFPQEADPSQAEALRQELRARLEGYPSYPGEAQPAARWQAGAQGRGALELFAPLQALGELHLQPACRRAAVAASPLAAETADAPQAPGVMGRQAQAASAAAH